MTDTEVANSVVSPGEVSKRSRRRMGWIIAGTFLLVCALASLMAARTLDHRYGPIQQGDFGGLYSAHNFVFSKDGFTYSLASTPGVTGELVASLDNVGAHSVKVNSIDTDAVVASIKWSAYVEGRTILGADTPWRAFPAIVPAHGTIRLLITIRHPSDCRTEPANMAGRYYSGFHTVHWESLLHDHTTVIDDGMGQQNIGVC